MNESEQIHLSEATKNFLISLDKWSVEVVECNLLVFFI